MHAGRHMDGGDGGFAMLYAVMFGGGGTGV